MTRRANKLLLILAMLLPALFASLARAQYVLTCPGSRIVITCSECIFKSNFGLGGDR